MKSWPVPTANMMWLTQAWHCVVDPERGWIRLLPGEMSACGPQRRFTATHQSFRSRRWTGLVADIAKTALTTHNGPRAGDQKLGDEKPEFLQLQGDGAASSLPSAIAPHGHSLQAAADEPGLPTANETGSARPNRSTNIVLNESSLGAPQAQITDQGAHASFRLQATLEMGCCPRGPTAPAVYYS
jgi:hypothetical protein